MLRFHGIPESIAPLCSVLYANLARIYRFPVRSEPRVLSEITTVIGAALPPFPAPGDTSLDKAFRIGERVKVRVRAQSFNTLNYMEFNAIGSTYGFNAAGTNTNTTTGQYTSTLQPRQGAVSVRVEF